MPLFKRSPLIPIIFIALAVSANPRVDGEDQPGSQPSESQPSEHSSDTETSSHLSLVAGRTWEGWKEDLLLKDRTARLIAARSLVVLGEPAGPTLQALLNDEDAAIRYVVAVGLGDIGGPTLAEATESLQSLVEEDSSQAVSMAAAYALCCGGEVDLFLKTLTDRLGHPERGMVCSAAELIGKIGSPAHGATGDLQAVWEAHKPGGPGDYHKGGAAKKAMRLIQQDPLLQNPGHADD